MKQGYTLINYEDDVKTKLTRNENLLKSKLNQISDLQYEVDLITNDSINIICGIYDPIQRVDLHKIWCDFDGNKHKFKPDAKDSKNQLKFVEDNYIFRDGKPKDVKLTDITLYGYCWEIWLKYIKNGKEFIITLPVFKIANKDNYKELGYMIMKVDGCMHTTVFSTLVLSELIGAVAEFLSKE